MSETSYTAWDDKLYQWPPPDGWYEAEDGKWWPEGYGPAAAGSDTATEAEAGAGGDGEGLDAGSDLVIDDGDGLSNGIDVADDASRGQGSGDGGSLLADAIDRGLSGEQGAATDSDIDSVSGALSGAVEGARSDVFADVTDATDVSDAGADQAADAASALGSFGQDVAPGAGSLLGEAADELSDGLTDAAPTFDSPAGDDVGAALAETMSTRSDDPADPASSGIAGFADAGQEPAGSAADAAADASQFLTADIPAYDPAGASGRSTTDPDASADRPGTDLDASGDRPGTDLDALPPPSFGAPSFGDGPSPAGDLGGLAPPGSDPPADEQDPNAAAPLFSTSAPTSFSPGAEGGHDSAPSGDLLGPPPDETLPPSASGSGTAGEPVSALDSDRGAEPAPSFDGPDETVIPPPGGSGSGQAELSQNPAETGQFNPAPTDASAPWASAPPGQFTAPPPETGAPGSMPWGQGAASGGPAAPGGFDPSVLTTADARSGSGRTLLYVLGGFVALVLLGIAAYVFLGDDSDGDSGVAETGPGSLAEPHARTTPVEVFYPTGGGEQRFVIEVLEPVRDASGQADGAPPADTDRFAVTRVRVTNQTTADAAVSDLRFNAVTAAGGVVDRQANSCAVTEPALDFAAVLGQAGVAEGVVCWVVPAEDFDGLLLGIESTQVSGRIHIRLQ